MDTHVWLMPRGFMQAPVNAAAGGSGWPTGVTAAAEAGAMEEAGSSDDGSPRGLSGALLMKLFPSTQRQLASSAAQLLTSFASLRRPGPRAARSQSTLQTTESHVAQSHSILLTPAKAVFRLDFKDQQRG